MKRKEKPTEALRTGRDYMNWAEFALASVATRPPDARKLVFEDRYLDEAGQWVEQRLEIVPSTEYGLPMHADVDVLLAAVQHAHLRGTLGQRHQRLSIYELLEILNWQHRGESYRRAKLAILRWRYTGLRYSRAWWNDEAKDWRDAHFSIFDTVVFRRRGGGEERTTLTWNEEVLRSGNLKTLDWPYYLSLNDPILKNAYRFLDKRFGRNKRFLEFDLRPFACAKIGLSDQYDTGQIKRYLKPLERFETDGYCSKPRYKQLARGHWRIGFTRIAAAPAPKHAAPPAAPLSPLAAALVARNVTEATARELADTFPEAQVTLQLEVHDWLVERKDYRIAKNPAGWLVEAVKQNYATPNGFEPKAQRDERLARERAAALAHRQVEEDRQRDEAAALAARRAPVLAYLSGLTPEERADLERTAFDEATNWHRKFLTSDGPAADAIRENVIDQYVRKKLNLPA